MDPETTKRADRFVAGVRYAPCAATEQRLMPFHAYASQEHWIDHLAPLFDGLDCEAFFVPASLSDYAMAHVSKPELVEIAPSRTDPWKAQWKYVPRPSKNPVIVAGIADAWTVAEYMRPILLLEHGCGLSFSGTQPSHSGGEGPRRFVDVFMMTNEWCAARDRKKWPKATVLTIGAPRLDKWANIDAKAHTDPPTVCYTTHWDAQGIPETRSAFDHFRSALPELKDRFNLIAHCHPRGRGRFCPQFAALDIEFVESQEDVFRRADLVIGDSGSMVYEFAYLDRPVVVCNAPSFRRNVNHGLRFWEQIPGLQCDHPDALCDCVEQALADPPLLQELRHDAIASVYPYRGHATEHAISLINEWRDVSQTQVGKTVYDLKTDVAKRLVRTLPTEALRRSCLWGDGEHKLRALVESAFPNHDGSLRILETGTCNGISASILSTYGTVDTFDIIKRPYVDSVLDSLGTRDRVTPHIIKTTSEIAEFIDGRDYDLAFIDGNHTYQGVSEDFNAIAPHCGVLIFHDHTAQFPDVPKFVSELSGGTVTINDPMAMWVKDLVKESDICLSEAS